VTKAPAPESARPVTVAVDAMGGDRAPAAVVAGACTAARRNPQTQVILVGDEAVINGLLADAPAPANVRVVHASQVVEMHEAPGAAVRQKRDSSIAVGVGLVRIGQADAVVSAGNSRAMMASATLFLKMLPGIDRPAIAVRFPTMTGHIVLLDAGANTDCPPHHLLQFAHLGIGYARLLGTPNPRVGLLSIGEEPSKGNEVTKETHKLLVESAINFVGNVEPKEMVHGQVDVVVCDGFAGNLMIKAGEGFGELFVWLMREAIVTHAIPDEVIAVVKPVLDRVQSAFDYAEVGGALLLGVNGVVVISHGRSDERAIENAVLLAARAAEFGHATAHIPQ
jgi:phosphate acyltransferase